MHTPLLQINNEGRGRPFDVVNKDLITVRTCLFAKKNVYCHNNNYYINDSSTIPVLTIR